MTLLLASDAVDLERLQSLMTLLVREFTDHVSVVSQLVMFKSVIAQLMLNKQQIPLAKVELPLASSTPTAPPFEGRITNLVPTAALMSSVTAFITGPTKIKESPAEATTIDLRPTDLVPPEQLRHHLEGVGSSVKGSPPGSRCKDSIVCQTRPRGPLSAKTCACTGALTIILTNLSLLKI